MPPTRDAIRALALTRIAFGVGLLVTPRLAAGLFLGPDARTPAATVLARALGARDVLVGGMLLHVSGTPEVARRWTGSSAAIDAIDGLAAVAAAPGLPPVRGRLFSLIAFGSAAAHGALAQRVASEPAAPAA